MLQPVFTTLVKLNTKRKQNKTTLMFSFKLRLFIINHLLKNQNDPLLPWLTILKKISIKITGGRVKEVNPIFRKQYQTLSLNTSQFIFVFLISKL